MDDEKTADQSRDPTEPPWDDIQADDPFVISRDGVVTARRVFHNIREPEWPPLVLDASITKPTNPEVALREILDALTLRMYYALVDGKPTGGTGPDPTSSSDGPAESHPGDVRDPAEHRYVPPIEFSFRLDQRDPPQGQPTIIYLYAKVTLAPNGTHTWTHQGSAYFSIHVYRVTAAGLSIVFPPSGPTQLVKSGGNSPRVPTSKATVHNNDKKMLAEYGLETQGWAKS